MILNLWATVGGIRISNLFLLMNRMICGAFTRSQGTSASRLLGFASAQDGIPTLLELRLLCLNHIDTLFSGLKEADTSSGHSDGSIGASVHRILTASLLASQIA
jgi:hypothetical protein